MNRLAGRSWPHLLAALALLISISAAGGLAAQTDEDAAAAPEGTEEASADTQVRQMIAEWKRTDPVARSFLERDDVSVVGGAAPVAVHTDDKRWGKGRSLAYTQAFIDAMKAYVLRVRTRQSITATRDQLDQDLDESEFVYQPGESADDYVSRMVTKAAALGERSLDNALVESGMSAEEIERLTPDQKKTTFTNNLLLQATSEAFGSAAGLVPVKTFEAFDPQGSSVIGIVAVSSLRMKDLAKQISGGKAIRPDSDRARTPIVAQIAALSDAALVNEFGPRVWWDEYGYPTIVSFGQWAWSPEGLDNRKKARRRAFAMKQATNDARSHLTMFINASTLFSEDSDRGVKAEEFSLVSADGTVSDEETAKIVDRLAESARVNSSVELRGLRIQREWFRRHPDLDHHELVGVIVSWSPAQEDQIRAELGKKPKHQPPAEKTVQKTSVKSGTAESQDLMDPADF